MRKLGLLLIAGAASALPAAPAAARTASPKHLRVGILIPAPGHVTLESISATVRHPSRAVRRSGLLNPRYLHLSSLPPSVRIVYLRRTFRKPGSVKTVLLLLVINRASPKGAARAAGNGPPQLVQVPPQGEPADAALRLVELFAGFANDTAVYDQVHTEEPAPVGLLAAGNLDLFKAPKQVRQAKGVISDLFNGHAPSAADLASLSNENGSSNPELDTGHYDDGHAFGWKAPDKSAIVALLAQVARSGPLGFLFRLESATGTDINNDGAIGAPAPKQQLYKFSFGPLALSFDDTFVSGGQSMTEHWSLQIQGGTACGTSLATAAFQIPWTLTNPGGPQQLTAQESFAVNPFRFYTFTDTNNNSTLAMNLRLISGSPSVVRVEATQSGSGITNVTASPQQATVTATPASSTC